MATCPQCGVSSREDAEAMVVEEVFVSDKPLGTFSLAGEQEKIPVRLALRLRCNRCGWSILGRIEGEHFVADPPADP